MPKTPAEHLLAPWTLDRARHVIRRSDGNQFTNDSRMDDDERQALVDAVNAGVNIEALRSDAFELGFKAAGGTMIPDEARNMIELAIDRSALNELIDFAEAGEATGGGPFSPAPRPVLRERQYLQEPQMKSYSIVGMNFRKSEDFVKSLQPGAEATLVREPSNRFDPNAVMVWIDGVHVGYIPKAQNKVLAQFIDQSGQAWPACGLAEDSSAPPNKAVPAKFVRSPNSGYPMVEVSE